MPAFSMSSFSLEPTCVQTTREGTDKKGMDQNGFNREPGSDVLEATQRVRSMHRLSSSRISVAQANPMQRDEVNQLSFAHTMTVSGQKARSCFRVRECVCLGVPVGSEACSSLPLQLAPALLLTLLESESDAESDAALAAAW